MAHSDQSNQPPKSKFRIENFSEATRKKIFGISILILMLIIMIAWIPSLQSAINQIKSTPTKKIFEDQELNEFQESLNVIINQTKKSGEEIQNRIDELNQLIDAAATSTASTSPNAFSTSTTTSSPEFNQEDIQKLKEKILEQID